MNPEGKHTKLSHRLILHTCLQDPSALTYFEICPYFSEHSSFEDCPYHTYLVQVASHFDNIRTNDHIQLKYRGNITILKWNHEMIPNEMSLAFHCDNIRTNHNIQLKYLGNVTILKWNGKKKWNDTKWNVRYFHWNISPGNGTYDENLYFTLLISVAWVCQHLSAEFCTWVDCPYNQK